MNAGFEVLYCDFDQGLDLVTHLNVADPFSTEGFGFPAPPDSPALYGSDELISRSLNLLEDRPVLMPLQEDGPDEVNDLRGGTDPLVDTIHLHLSQAAQHGNGNEVQLGTTRHLANLESSWIQNILSHFTIQR